MLESLRLVRSLWSLTDFWKQYTTCGGQLSPYLRLVMCPVLSLKIEKIAKSFNIAYVAAPCRHWKLFSCLVQSHHHGYNYMCLDTSGMHLQSTWAAVLTKVEQYSTSNAVMQQIEIQDRTIFNIFTEVLPLLSRLYLYSDIPPIFEWVSHKMSWMLLQLYEGYTSHKMSGILLQLYEGYTSHKMSGILLQLYEGYTSHKMSGILLQLYEGYTSHKMSGILLQLYEGYTSHKMSGILLQLYEGYTSHKMSGILLQLYEGYTSHKNVC